MTVRHVFVEDHQLLVGGSGYVPEGELTAENHDDDAAAIAAACAIIRCGVLCNDAQLRREAGDGQVEGDPMEGALTALAMKAGFNPNHVRGEWARLDEIPFDAAYRFMATLHRSPAGESIVFLKGAPEALLAMTRDVSVREVGHPHRNRCRRRRARARFRHQAAAVHYRKAGIFRSRGGCGVSWTDRLHRPTAG
ncbi:hypothetical protein [Nitrobacter vulgaris]|uniref:hypothetical protein n=1 Tax=Nitrobacter vulgaris TaxID=29421 RepID=UPI001FCD31EB|nr:hypothetical protein [Nitrobacter vulgaris]